MNFSVDEIFKVLNLFLRIGLIIFVIKRYVIGRIMLYMTQKQNKIYELQQQRFSLKEECDNVEKAMKAEQDAFSVMQEKFVVWDSVVKAATAQEQIECQERQKTMNALTKCKLESMQRRHLMQTEVTEIISQTASDLEQKFQNNKTLGQKYITKVLDALAE